MARLTLPDVGTVVRVEGDLEASLLASGWVAADESAEKSAPKRRSSKKAD